MEQTVLCCNLKGTKKEKGLKLIFGFLGCRVLHVEREQFLWPIGVLAGVDEPADVMPSYDGEGFSDEMLIMYLQDGDVLDTALRMMRREKATVALKAVLTPTNKDWSLLALHDELKREHEYMQRSAKP